MSTSMWQEEQSFYCSGWSLEIKKHSGKWKALAKLGGIKFEKLLIFIFETIDLTFGDKQENRIW